MRRGYTAADVRAAERPLLDRGLGETLMARAAYALAQVCLRELREHAGGAYGRRAVVLAGPGNNGGDARIAAGHLARAGVGVELVDALALDAADAPALGRRLADAELVVDGVFGTGARPGLPAALASAVAHWREARGQREPGRNTPAADVPAGHRRGPEGTARRRGPRPGTQRVIAVDIPSGVDGTDGTTRSDAADGLPEYIAADVTVTFAEEKAGLLLPPGRVAAGRVEVADIGVEIDTAPDVLSLEPADLAGVWPTPAQTAHKYSRGVLGLLAGSAEYPGAAILTATAALSTGVGMLRVLTAEPARTAVLQACPETVPGEGRVQAWALGPGAPEPERMQAIMHQIAADAAGSTAQDGSARPGSRVPPAVLDAAALDLLDGPLAFPAVLTPHAGELSRLLGRLGEPAAREEIEAAPVRYARRAAELTAAVVLLKGAVTLVAVPSGPVFAQSAGTPWLATAGSGDVLTGIIGAALAAGFLEGASHEDLPRMAELAAAAAEIHGLSAWHHHPDGGSPRRGRELRQGPQLGHEAGHRRPGPVRARDLAWAVRDTLSGLLGA
ncbi:bifunctional ADP-dependent NAD(P)H-hydrate dehydratase/NAD(P)H-hydrate epimerase [Sediminivirga luteola]|uniref:ADP-dependent (S)-NAD(P)H-hydrate dehydratase n=1 Tax=Sediminivirga luteola TaxID=1774748 RepID=A0A8J2XKH8_9MICO|nr:bifunctional ADP-dependent NAD(P)H-hydrate dehydratase/NAD(P)H-hydrate epimerase [Sediminivirga luteola]MCI2265505.1 bifunctional ADP-dependent NAD(P)H-hydrate dehydratase/NAD(P)H-hydrate epimerase [Sediminivirga luteola]GGA10053.1 bifunctional NAD(P)H-hydrate repair enzyme [Sediminivirga luteola]